MYKKSRQSASDIIKIDNLNNPVIRAQLRTGLFDIQENFLPQSLLQSIKIVPKSAQLLSFKDKHDAHRTTYLLFFNPLQPPHVLRSIS